MTINYPVKLFASSYLRITHFSAFTFSSPVLLPFQDVLVQQNSHQILFYLECSLPCLFPVLNLHKSRLKTLFCDDEGCTRITADFEVNKVKLLVFGCEYCLCGWLWVLGAKQVLWVSNILHTFIQTQEKITFTLTKHVTNCCSHQH